MTLTKSALPGAIFALTFFAQPTFAHDFWINHGSYKSPTDGSHCCGDNDCKVLSPEEVRITPRGYVLTNGELIPYSESQTSEDGLFWRCKRHDGSRRCFFAPQPST